MYTYTHINCNVVYYIDRDVNGVGIVSSSGRMFVISVNTEHFLARGLRTRRYASPGKESYTRNNKHTRMCVRG